MAKGFYLIFFLCYIFGDCVSGGDNGIIKFYTHPPNVTDKVSKVTLHCKVNSSIPLNSVHIDHNGDTISTKEDQIDDNQELEVLLDTSRDFSGNYTCTADGGKGSKNLEVVIYPTCVELSSLNKTIVKDFSDKLINIDQADLGDCLKKALYKIVNLTDSLTDSSLVGSTPPTDPPPTEEMSATVNMTVSGCEIHARNDLNVSCTTNRTVVQKGVRFSWRWTEWKYINSTEDPNMNEFDWSVVLRNGTNGTVITSCGDSNSTCEGSNLTISAAHVQRSGRFFCVAEFSHGVRSVSHEVGYSDIRVVNQIEDLYLIWNGTRLNQTVPIVIPHGSPLEVNCTATGKWAPPDTVNITVHIGNESLRNESSSDPASKTTTTTAKLTILWETIEGKDVEVLCEAIGDHKSNRTINATVEVSNPIKLDSLHLIWNGTYLNEAASIVIPHDTPLEVTCTATGEYAPPDTVDISAQIDEKKLVNSSNENSNNTKTTTAKLTIPWKAVNGKNVTFVCEAKGERNSKPDITSSIVNVSSATQSTVEPTSTTSDSTSTASVPSESAVPSESSVIFGTPTVFGGIATILVVVVVIGVVVVAYRSRDKLRSWIMEKDVSKAALRKAKYARAKGGRGWIKYAKLPRDISEAMSHNE